MGIKEGSKSVAVESLKELPDSVRDNLPKHAQEVYLAAYNNAWEEYKNVEDRKGGASREEVSHKVAWNAVKRSMRRRMEIGRVRTR